MFLNWQFYWKNQYSKLLFSHESCQYEQDDASHKGKGDDNSNFNLISKYGEEFETTFKKALKFLPFLNLLLKTLLLLKNPIVT